MRVKLEPVTAASLDAAVMRYQRAREAHNTAACWMPPGETWGTLHREGARAAAAVARVLCAMGMEPTPGVCQW